MYLLLRGTHYFLSNYNSKRYVMAELHFAKQKGRFAKQIDMFCQTSCLVFSEKELI